MNYYYFFVLLHYYLGVRSCNCLQSRDLFFDFQHNSTNQSSTSQYCQHFINYSQVVALLSRYNCSSLGKHNQIRNNNDRARRDIDAGSIDIKALQTTINDHRIMIEYLFNNSINETFLGQTLKKQSRMGPSFSSWRDLVDLFCIGLVSIIVLYLLICRTGFSACDHLIAFLFRPVLVRLQQKQNQYHHHHHQQEQHTSNSTTEPTNTISEHLKSLSTIADGIQQYSNRTKN
jgi:hypothetical protein